MSDTTAQAHADGPPDVERRVEEIADEYLDRLQAGEAPDRGAVVAAHPDLADLLEGRLALVELMHRVGRGADAAETPLPALPARSPLPFRTVSAATSSAAFWAGARRRRSTGPTTRRSAARWR
jgi:hypothetical protein